RPATSSPKTSLDPPRSHPSGALPQLYGSIALERARAPPEPLHGGDDRQQHLGLLPTRRRHSVSRRTHPQLVPNASMSVQLLEQAAPKSRARRGSSTPPHRHAQPARQAEGELEPSPQGPGRRRR